MKWSDKPQNKKYIQRLIQLLSDDLKDRGAGSISYSPAADYYIDGLLEFIDFGDRPNWLKAFRLIKKSLIELKREQVKIEPEILLSRLSEHYSESQKLYSFRVLIPVVPMVGLELIDLEIDGCELRFEDQWPQIFADSRKQLIADHKDIKEYDSGELDYKYCIIRVETDGPESAFERGYAALGVYRAIHELSTQPIAKMTFGRGPLTEVILESKIHLGQFFTVHKESGEIATRSLWHQPMYNGRNSQKCLNPEEQRKLILKLYDLYSRSPLRNHLNIVLNLMVDALDAYLGEDKYLRLHTAVEVMVKSDNTNTIVKRLSFPPRSKNIEKSIIASLRLSRNKLIHSGVAQGEAAAKWGMKTNILLELMKNYIGFMLRNDFNYENINSFVEFTSLGFTSKVEIERKISELQSLMTLRDQ